MYVHILPGTLLRKNIVSFCLNAQKEKVCKTESGGKMKVGNAIEVRHVTKKFRVYMDRGHTLKEIALFKNVDNMKKEQY